MKFCNTEIPQSLFNSARERMRRDATFTPEDIRHHLFYSAREELIAIDSIQSNQRAICERVMRACVDELREAGEIIALKRGVWARVDGSAPPPALQAV